MDPGDGDLGLVRPTAAQLALATGQDGAGFGVDEELADLGRRCQPRAVVFDNLGYVGWFAIDGYLARPGERGASILTGLGEWTTVLGHLLVGEAAQNAGRQYRLDEQVALQDHLLTSRGAKPLEDASGGFGP